MPKRYRLLTAIALGSAASVLALFVALNSFDWIEAKTPGFFIDPSRQVSLLTLPGWPQVHKQWPSEIKSVDGLPAREAAQFYQLVRTRPEGADIVYKTTRLGVPGEGFSAKTRTITGAEYGLLFLGLVINGLITILVAVSVWRRHPDSASANSALAAGMSLGVLAITSVATTIGDGSLARLQILAQSMAPAALIHLALVFPSNLLRNAKSPAYFAIYTPFAALALMYQLTWPDPYGSGMLHAAATLAIIGAGVGLVGSVLVRLLPGNPIVVRRRAAIAGTGMVGVITAALLWGSIGGFDWRAMTAALFACGGLISLAIGGAISGRDFFSLDERLRAIITYATAIPAVAVLYFGSVYLLGPKISDPSSPMAGTAPFALLNLGLLFAVSPVIRVVRGWVDRMFSPETYSADRSLSNLNRGLSSARTTQTLAANTLEVLKRTLGPKKATVFLRGRGAGFPLFAYDDPEQRKLAVPTELVEKLEAGENAVRYQWDDGSGRTIPPLLDRLDADLMVPMYRSGACVGVIALSAKESGHPYDARDIAFIRAAANQIALALPNAAAQDKLDILHKNLDELNESLRVQTNRTETLKAMNSELGEALNQLRDTHHRLTENQQEILRAERLSALSRLSVGLTQEISGPLGTVLNSLQGIAKIGKDNTGTVREPAKQRQAIDEMLGHAQTGAAWVERTISYLRSFQALGRGAATDKLESFAVRDAFSDVTQLLRLRLRETACSVNYKEDPDALQLYGSRQRFALVLVDLVTAAIQAYQEAQIRDGIISVEAELTSQGVTVHVVDWAGGVPAAAIPRLLDQLGSDEMVGNRRGLWIAKNLVEEGFGGTLEAVTNDERTCFSAVFPSVFAQRGPMAPPPSIRKVAG